MCWVQAETLDDNHTYTGDMILQKKKISINAEEHTFFYRRRNLGIKKNLLGSGTFFACDSDAIWHQWDGSVIKIGSKKESNALYTTLSGFYFSR